MGRRAGTLCALRRAVRGPPEHRRRAFMQRGEDIGGGEDGSRAAREFERAARTAFVPGAVRHDAERLSEAARRSRSAPCPALQARLDDNGGARQCGEDSVALDEAGRRGAHVVGRAREEGTAGRKDTIEERHVLAWVGPVEATSGDHHRESACLERSLVRGRVDPDGAAGPYG